MVSNSVEEYIEKFGSSKKDISNFVAFMEAEFPNVAPKITYSMPVWWAGKKLYDGYIGISAARAHYSIHFGEETYIAKLKEALPDSSFGKRCVNVKYGDESAITVVKKYVKEYFSSALK